MRNLMMQLQIIPNNLGGYARLSDIRVPSHPKLNRFLDRIYDFFLPLYGQRLIRKDIKLIEFVKKIYDKDWC